MARRAGLLLLLALVSAACIDTESDADMPEEVTPARWLDTLCAANAYELAGTAVRTSGLSPDSCGFVLGPGQGSVTFDTEGWPTGGGGTRILALVADIEGESIANPRWVALSEMGVPTAIPGSTNVVTPRVMLESQGKHLSVVDLKVERMPAPEYGGGCSIARR